MRRSVTGVLTSVASLLASTLLAATLELDPSFNPPNLTTAGFGGTQVVLQKNGDIILAGNFQALAGAVTRNRIARFKTAGTLDATFNPGSGIGGSVTISALAVQPDDRILLGGTFSGYDGNPAPVNVARLNPNGDLDTLFTATTDAAVQGITVLPGGRLLIGGKFTKVNGVGRANVALLESNGAVVESFNPVWGAFAPAVVGPVARQADGKILVGGGYFVGGTFKGICRLDETGVLDPNFHSPDLEMEIPAIFSVYDIAVLPGGKILVGGGFRKVDAKDQRAVVRLNSDGTVDTEWNSGLGSIQTPVQFKHFAVDSSGKVTAAGQFAASVTFTSGTPFVRFNSDGTLDTSLGTFTPSAMSLALGLAVQPDGKVIISGSIGSSSIGLQRFVVGTPVVMPPQFITRPTSQGVEIGKQAAFNFQTVGTEPLTYEWFKGTTSISKLSTPALVFPSAIESDDADYYVRVSNSAGFIESGPVHLTVVQPQPEGLAGIATGTTRDLTGVSFLNAYTGCVVGNGGLVLVTSNGGQTWRVSNTGVSNNLTSIRLVGSVAYLGGVGGLLCISTNGGLSWRAFETGTTETFNGLSFDSTTSGFAVGTRGTIGRYNGSGWVVQSTGTGADFYGVAAVGSVAFAVGANGTICRYNGNDWVAQATGTTSTFYGVDFLSENYGLAVGAGGLICRWNGTAWRPVESGVTSSLRSIQIVDADLAYATGDGGVFLRTTDGGTTWKKLSINSSAGVFGVVVSGGRGFAFGTGGAGFAFQATGQPINQPPLVSILSPLDGAVIRACLKIRIVASAVDPDGNIARVEFYRGQFKLAESTRPPRPGRPYEAEFHPDALGHYELRVVAIDNLGATTVSDPVGVDVVPPPLNTAVAEEYLDATGCSICFRGDVGGRYVLQGLEDLRAPLTWARLQTNVMPELLLRVIDSGATNHPYRFYRFLKLP